MAFTLYKLPLKLLSSVRIQNAQKGGVGSKFFIFTIFCKLTNKKQKKVFGSLAPPLGPPLKFFWIISYN